MWEGVMMGLMVFTEKFVQTKEIRINRSKVEVHPDKKLADKQMA